MIKALRTQQQRGSSKMNDNAGQCRERREREREKERKRERKK